MKSKLPIALVCFSLGFLAAWLIRDQSTVQAPDTANHSPVSTSATNSSAEKPSTNLTKSSPLARSARKPGAEQENEEAKRSGKSMAFDAADFLKNTVEKKDQSLLEKLTRELNLSPAQVENLRAALAARSGKIGELDFMDENDEPLLKELLDNKKLDEQIIAQLSDEQKTSFSAMKEKERQSKIDSNTLKNLGKITEAITLNEDQRTAVYNALANKEAELFDSEQQNFQKTLFAGLGMGEDDDMSLHGIVSDPAIQEQMKNAGTGPEAQQVMATAMREALTKKVDEKVNLIAPHLTAEQSAQYRQHLQQKADSSLNVLEGSMIQMEQ